MHLPPRGQTTCGIRPASHPTGSGAKRPGSGTAQSLLFSAEVKDAWRCTGCPKKIVPFSKIFLWAPDVILESFIYQKLGNKSKFFPTLQRFNMGALRDTADI